MASPVDETGSPLARVCIRGCIPVQPESLGHYIRLNVGGQLFHTTLDTLTKRDSMLRAMFTGEVKVLVDAEGKRLAFLLLA